MFWRVVAREAPASVARPHACSTSKQRASCISLRWPGSEMGRRIPGLASPRSSTSNSRCRASADSCAGTHGADDTYTGDSELRGRLTAWPGEDAALWDALRRAGGGGGCEAMGG